MICLRNLIIKLSSTLSMGLEILLLLLNLGSLGPNQNNKIRELEPQILVIIRFYTQMDSRFSEGKITRNFKTDKNHIIMQGIISQLIKLIIIIIKILLTAVLLMAQVVIIFCSFDQQQMQVIVQFLNNKQQKVHDDKVIYKMLEQH